MTTSKKSDVSVSTDFLQGQIDQARTNLRLIETRKSQYVLSTDIPLQLEREEEQWRARLSALEEQAARRTALTVAGAEPRPGERSGRGLLLWLLGTTLVAALVAIGLYALYLVTAAAEMAMPALVGVSLLGPFVVGGWAGWQEPESWRRDYHFGVALTVGLLNALGVATCLRIYLRNGPIHIDWNRIFELYFLAPAILFVAGRTIGGWWRHRAMAVEVDAFAPAAPTTLTDRLGMGPSSSEALLAFGALMAAVVTVWLAYGAATR